MAFGAAPFFANDIKSTYQKIVDHKKSLRFRPGADLSAAMKDLIGRFESFIRCYAPDSLVLRLLTDAEVRLGRHGCEDIQRHTAFQDIAWGNIRER